MIRIMIKQKDNTVGFGFDDEYLEKAFEFAKDCMETGDAETEITIRRADDGNC